MSNYDTYGLHRLAYTVRSRAFHMRTDSRTFLGFYVRYLVESRRHHCDTLERY